MNTIDCTDIKAMLSALVDGELDGDMRHLAERHVTQCADCRKLVDQTEKLDTLITESTGTMTPDTLSDDFVGLVLSRTIYSQPPVPMAHHRPWGLWAGWAAAAAAIGLAALAWFDRQPQSDDVVVYADATDVAQAPAVTPPQAQPAESSPRIAAAERPPSQQPAIYQTGVDLESHTMESPLPADAFRPSAVSLVAASQPTAEIAEATEQPQTPARHERALAALEAIDMNALMANLMKQGQQQSPPTPTIDREDADALYAASIALGMLASGDTGQASFADVERVRRVVEADDLLPRLTGARNRLQPADRPAVLAAESVLTRVTQGPLDTSDVRLLRETVARLNLPSELGEITNRWDRASSL